MNDDNKNTSMLPQTPLSYAARNGKTEVVQVLLNANANVNVNAKEVCVICEM